LTYTTANGKKKTFELLKAPEVGKRPLDMILDSSGNLAKKHRLHKGHEIVEILE